MFGVLQHLVAQPSGTPLWQRRAYVQRLHERAFLLGVGCRLVDPFLSCKAKQSAVYVDGSRHLTSCKE